MKIFNTPWRLSGIAGLLFVTLSLIASAINVLPPTYDQDPSTFPAWFAENAPWYRVGHLLAGIAFLLFYFPFFAGLCERLRAAEGKPEIWSRVTWAGAIISPAAGTTAGACMMGNALLNGHASSEAVQFGLAANFYAYVVAGAFGGVTMIGAAIVILRTGVFKPWLGWAGLFVGFPAIISVGTLVQNDPQGMLATINGLAWILYFLWIAILSVELIRIPPVIKGT